MGRRILVWTAAFALRRGADPADVMVALVKSYRHRDSDWRMAVINDATARNLRRASRKAPVA